MFRVDLNSDLGESFGAYRIGCDREVLEQVTSACAWAPTPATRTSWASAVGT